jgi:hypothetical protein
MTESLAAVHTGIASNNRIILKSEPMDIIEPVRYRRDGRVVECAGLEIRYTVKRIQGSNPCSSASTLTSNWLNANGSCLKPRTMRGFLLIAPDCGSRAVGQKAVSKPFCLRTS